jgi:hypothetical protein
MNTIRTLLADDRSPENRCELSDYGINTLREYAAKVGWDRTTLRKFLLECLAVAKAANCTADLEGFKTYTHARRYSEDAPVRVTIRSSRAARSAAFAQLVGCGAV